MSDVIDVNGSFSFSRQREIKNLSLLMNLQSNSTLSLQVQRLGKCSDGEVGGKQKLKRYV